MTVAGEVWSTWASPVGPLTLIGRDGGIAGLYLDQHRHGITMASGRPRDDAYFAAAMSQLAAYFAGELTDFALVLTPRGTDFQQRVWAALTQIPYGTTTTYGALTARLGAPGASRAVGMANGRNPISIIVPCHRVVGSDGALRGFGGGVDNKRWLLDHERAVLGRSV